MSLLNTEQETYLKEVFDQQMVKDVTISLFSQPLSGLIIPGNEREAQFCAEANEVVEAVAALSDKIHLDVYDHRTAGEKMRSFGIDRAPSLVITTGEGAIARFLGVPSGYEFSTLVQDILDLSMDVIELSEDTQEFLRSLEEDLTLRVFVTPSCPYCPQASRMAQHMSAVNPERIKAVTIEATEFPDLARYYEVRAVPRIVINEQSAFDGALPERMFIAEVRAALGKELPSPETEVLGL